MPERMRASWYQSGPERPSAGPPELTRAQSGEYHRGRLQALSESVTTGILSRFKSAGVADYAASPRLLRWSFALAAALAFWSLVGGAAYLIVVERRLPLQVDALDEARWRFRRGDIKGALREYRWFTAMSPFETRARAEMGFLLLKDSRVEEAAAVYEDLLRLQPRDTAALTGLAEVRLTQGRPAEAVFLYEAALPLLPESAALHRILGKAYALSGDPDGALRQYDAALRLGPDPETTADRDRALADKARLEASRSGRP